LAYFIDDGMLAETMMVPFFYYENWTVGWKWKDWTLFCHQVTVVSHSFITLLGMRLS
jgi:hypothetical protein